MSALENLDRFLIMRRPHDSVAQYRFEQTLVAEDNPDRYEILAERYNAMLNALIDTFGCDLCRSAVEGRLEALDRTVVSNCPVCSAPPLLSIRENYDETHVYRIRCSYDQSHVFTAYQDSRDEAVKAWNDAGSDEKAGHDPGPPNRRACPGCGLIPDLIMQYPERTYAIEHKNEKCGHTFYGEWPTKAEAIRAWNLWTKNF